MKIIQQIFLPLSEVQTWLRPVKLSYETLGVVVII